MKPEPGEPAAPAGAREAARAEPAPCRVVAPKVDVRALLRLAWPAVLSYTLGNAYRVNDQFWVQGLGAAAQTAIGATVFILIMNFALVLLCVGGTLALVARATGAGDRARRDDVLRTAFGMAFVLSAILSLAGPSLVPWMVARIGLTGETAELGRQYLTTLYLGMLPMIAVPLVDNALIGMGNTFVPMLMQLVSLATNFCLAPLLIYGAQAGAHSPHPVFEPVARLAGAAAELAGLEQGLGMTGAALATVLSRVAAGALGLFVLFARYRVRLRGPRTTAGRFVLARAILAISAPVSLSLALYAGVYWTLLGSVLAGLGPAVIGGLGIGFQVFEGVAFPCYLGVAQACASLVGRALGAGAPDSARRAVHSGYRLASVLGIGMALVFTLAGPALVPLFTHDAGIAREGLVYVRTLAFAQLFVALEAVNEKTLVGAGWTRPALWISGTGNLLRLPLAWWLVSHLGLGAAGVWWAINTTSVLKATALWLVVRRGRWLAQKGIDAPVAAFE